MMDYIVLEEPSSSFSYIGSGDDGGACGGRAIDRHNPIIRDEKRLNQGRFSPSSPIITSTTSIAAMKGGDQKKKTIAFTDDDDNESIKTYDLISPASSSRCLLTEKAKFDFSWEIYHAPPLSPPHESQPTTPQPPPPPPPPPPYDDPWFLDSDDDDDSLTYSPPKPPPSPPLEPMNFHKSKIFNTKHHDSLYDTVPKPPSQLPPPPPAAPPPSSDQVVVLEVSLHCRGCERKMKKHISKIEGVKSFKIEFAAKKVTVVGNVTPLAVLTSVLKVKNAKLLTPATISSSPSQTCSPRNLSL